MLFTIAYEESKFEMVIPKTKFKKSQGLISNSAKKKTMVYKFYNAVCTSTDNELDSTI